MSGICSDPDIQEGAECLLGARTITRLLEQAGVLNLRVWPSERQFSRSMLLTSRMISAFCWCVSVFESFYKKNLDVRVSPIYLRGFGVLL